jgi:hypothetical protein
LPGHSDVPEPCFKGNDEGECAQQDEYEPVNRQRQSIGANKSVGENLAIRDQGVDPSQDEDQAKKSQRADDCQDRYGRSLHAG